MTDTTTRRLLAYVAASLVAGGATVTEAEREVRRVGGHLGLADVQVSATPTTIWLALRSGEPATVERIEGSLRLDQTLAVSAVRRDLMADRLDIATAVQRLVAARGMPPAYGRPGLYVGNSVVAMGICLIMQPVLANVLLVGLSSLLVSWLILRSGRHALLGSLLPSAAALIVALLVLEATRLGLVHGPLRTLICPIAVLLPGALLSTGIAELATGAVISGSARVFHGVVQLLLFTLGVVAACLVLGVPTASLTNTRVTGLGPLAPLVGLGCISLGITLAESVPWRLYGWSTLVLVATFATQWAGQSWGHSLPVGSFLGAVTASFLAPALEARFPSATRLVTFLPSFWLLVPGTLGLMGITTLGTGTGQADAVYGVVTLVTAIALGMLVGSALALPVQRLSRRRHVAERPLLRRQRPAGSPDEPR